MKTVLIILLLLLTGVSFGQTASDSLIGLVDQQLIKINQNNGGISAPMAINGIPAGVNPIRLTWCEPNQCFYALSQTYPPILSKIDANGNYTTIGQLTYPMGNLYMCEALSFNRADGELYASASLNGDPNSSPPDFYSEVLVRIDTTALTTTLIGTFAAPTPTLSEADNFAFDDNGILFFYDGQPGQFNRIYMQDLSFTNAPTLVHSAGYDAVTDLTVKGSSLYFSQDRILREIDIPTLTFSNVGTLFTTAQFNGQKVRGITWRTACNTVSLFGNDTTICTGQSLMLSPSISGSSYLWQDGSTNATYNATTSGLYWVEVQDAGCTFIDSITVSVESSPSVNLGNDTTICSGESVVLQPTGSTGTYTWQDGSSAATYTATQSGTYTVTVSNGCGSASDAVIVDIIDGLNFDFGNDTSFCEGSSIELQGPPGADTYLWQDGSTATSLTVNSQGLYWLEVTSNGCVTSDSVSVNALEPPIVELGEDRVLCEGETTVLSADDPNSSFSWNNGSSEPSIITNGDGIYWVTASNECGSSSDSVFITSEVCFCEMYVPNAFTPNDDEYNNVFGPAFDCPVFDYSIEIYNRWGERIFESTDPNETWDGQFKGKPIQDGIYVYKIIYSSEYFIGKTLVGHVNVIR